MRSKKENISFFEDMFKIAGGAVKTMGDIKEYIRPVVHSFLNELDLVTRDEFERIEAVAKKAREQQVALEKRIKALEGKKTKKPATKKSTAKKTATRKKTK